MIVGDLLATMNHSEYAASILKPYVRPNTYWMIRHHGLFQGYFYFHHFGMDRNAREQHRGHPAFEMCMDFCDKYDQASFDPDYDTMPLAAFEPMVRGCSPASPGARTPSRTAATASSSKEGQGVLPPNPHQRRSLWKPSYSGFKGYALSGNPRGGAPWPSVVHGVVGAPAGIPTVGATT